ARPSAYLDRRDTVARCPAWKALLVFEPPRCIRIVPLPRYMKPECLDNTLFIFFQGLEVKLGAHRHTQGVDASVTQRSSPAGRPIRLHTSNHTPPRWLARRRRAYRLIDQLADSAKHLVRHWLLPRPRDERRHLSPM